jgi:diguanylate cyclase (GGDEF)-like protein
VLVLMASIITVTITVYATFLQRKSDVGVKNQATLTLAIILGLSFFSYYSIVKPDTELAIVSSITVIMIEAVLITLLSIRNLNLTDESEWLEEEVSILGWENSGLDNSENLASLSGLNNQDYFKQKLDEEITRALRQKNPLYLAMFEIDNKRPQKNTVAVVGNIISKNIRDKIDTGAHNNGNQFSVILPYTTRDQAVTIAKRILVRLNSWDLTASMGLVSCNDIGATSAKELTKIAKMAIGEARSEGGNRIRLLEKTTNDKTEFVVPKHTNVRHLKLID